ncbi:hypothetical protein PRIPAC_71489 [Pristionchus pacificus]|uniref:Uncharacterized protein n=1 Tax=Pristionchus pacificus TaxID=54126 RepID=A0A2A6C6U1_PRIPA|nr:hypothetical protein PRIPAC_71489 [Pristionchus pacificus]|eukprot:PDM73837.1 hypothetical protein PRIPAC_41193 [Pristionchus pacificus]
MGAKPSSNYVDRDSMSSVEEVCRLRPMAKEEVAATSSSCSSAMGRRRVQLHRVQVQLQRHRVQVIVVVFECKVYSSSKKVVPTEDV